MTGFIIFAVATLFFINILLAKLAGKQKQVIQGLINAGIFLFLYLLLALQCIHDFIAFIKELI